MTLIWAPRCRCCTPRSALTRACCAWTSTPAASPFEAQDPRQRRRGDRGRYGVVTYLGVLPLRRLSGPEPDLLDYPGSRAKQKVVYCQQTLRDDVAP
jgi:hypothetical protein